MNKNGEKNVLEYAIKYENDMLLKITLGLVIGTIRLSRNVTQKITRILNFLNVDQDLHNWLYKKVMDCEFCANTAMQI